MYMYHELSPNMEFVKIPTSLVDLGMTLKQMFLEVYFDQAAYFTFLSHI